MKKLCSFLFSAILMIGATSCLDYSGLDDEPENVANDYFVKVNGAKVADNDTVYVAVNDIILFEMFDAKGNKVDGVFYSNNLNSAFGTGTIANIQYTATGVYKVTVNLENGSKTLYVYVSVGKTTKCTLKINGQVVSDGATFKATTAQSLKFEVVNKDCQTVKTGYDFGDGTNKIITSYSLLFSYADAGNYTLTASTEDEKITVNMQITKEASDAVVLITSSISGSTINATLGFRCNAIPNFSGNKATYVAGEIPGISWKKYDVSEITSIGGIDYFKWSVSVPAGKFRLSWIQQKDAGATFSYDACNWAHDSASSYWNGTDYLFYFYLRIVNNKVIISANAS